MRPRKCECNQFSCYVCRTRNYKRRELGLPLEMKEIEPKIKSKLEPIEPTDEELDRKAREWKYFGAKS